MKVREVKGVLSEFGGLVAYSNNYNAEISTSIYAYVNVGDETLSRIGIRSGLETKFKNLLGEEITLHIVDKLIIAITDSRGRTYGTNFGNQTFLLLFFGSLAFPFLFFYGLGILIYIMLYKTFWKVRRLNKTVHAIPNVILI